MAAELPFLGLGPMGHTSAREQAPAGHQMPWERHP
jgi:hypothetical protein